MTLLDSHLEQISQSAAAISDLPFPPPKIFTNALLQPHDITTLIRDTEAHERALFSVTGEPDLGPRHLHGGSNSSKPVSGTAARDVPLSATGHRKRAYRGQNTVHAVLGGHMIERIKKAGGNTTRDESGQREQGELDVDVLLEGAQKLCAVYPTPGAVQKISSLRARYGRLSSSIEHYEALVADLSRDLDRGNRSGDQYQDLSTDEEGEVQAQRQLRQADAGQVATEEDLKREEEEIRGLERKKRELEERVSGMERDLGGLLR